MSRATTVGSGPPRNDKLPPGGSRQDYRRVEALSQAGTLTSTARGVFLDYWNAYGGLAQFGYPISGEISKKSPTDGKSYTVQYFERAEFELHPDNQAPYNVLLALLGSMRYGSVYAGQ